MTIIINYIYLGSRAIGNLLLQSSQFFLHINILRNQFSNIVILMYMTTEGNLCYHSFVYISGYNCIMILLSFFRLFRF